MSKLTHHHIIAREFNDDLSMLAWLASEEKLAELKRQYPPARYTASVDVISRQVIVVTREDAI